MKQFFNKSKSGWLKVCLVIIFVAMFWFRENSHNNQVATITANTTTLPTTSPKTITTERLNSLSHVDAQFIANRLFIEKCRQEIPNNPLHRLRDEMSFCIAELKKVEERANYSDLIPKVVFSTTIGLLSREDLAEYQLEIMDSQDNGITISVKKDGKIIAIDNTYEPFKDGWYPDYISVIWEAKTGLGDKVIVISTSRGGTWRGSEQLRAVFVDSDTGELIITPSVIVSDELTIADDDDYINALAKEIGNLMRLQLKGIK